MAVLASWRRGLVVLAVVTLLAVIAACGDDATATPTAAGPEPTPTPTGEAIATPTPTATPIPAWQLDWDATLAAAKEEGSLVIGVARQPYREGAEFFQAEFPDIEIEAVIGRGGGQIQRLIRERDASIFSMDVFLSGTPNMIVEGVANGLPADLRSLLIIPELLEGETWVGGTFDDMWCDDSTKNIAFCHWAEQSSANAEVNRELAPEAVLNRIDDLFRPEFRGRWCLFDPRGFGSGNAFITELIVVRGSDFVRRLLTETEPVLSRDDRQMSADIIRGEFVFCVTSQIPTFHLEGVGLHVQEIVFEQPTIHPEFAGRLASTCCGTGVGKETLDGFFSSLIGGPVVIDRGPNPNAAKIFVNWILTHDGATDYLRPHDFTNCSARVSLQDLCEKEPLEAGKSYFSSDRQSTIFVRQITTEVAEGVFGGR